MLTAREPSRRVVLSDWESMRTIHSAWDDAMDFYRLYVLGIDDQIIELIELRFPDDQAAVDYAKRRVHGRRFELWRRDRRIAMFSAK